MKTYIAILRGINVSGHKMIKMEAIRKMFEELNFKNVKTYIQSGNVVFQSKEINSDKIEKKISKKIQDLRKNIMVLKNHSLYNLFYKEYMISALDNIYFLGGFKISPPYSLKEKIAVRIQTFEMKTWYLS